MKNIGSIIISICGILLFFVALFNGGDVWSFLLAIGMVFAPFTALAILFTYLLMIGILIGMTILGAYIGVQIGGKDSFLAFAGILAGGFLGFSFVITDKFDSIFIEPLRKVTTLDED